MVEVEHTHGRDYERPRYELAEVFRRYLPEYRRRHKLSSHEESVLEAIQKCRTAELGVHHEEVCDHCHYVVPAYNSCRNRNCPKCQGGERYKWVQARIGELLPIPYYHVVLTLPHLLNALALYNKAVIYDIFFKAAAATLLAFGWDARHLGAELGLIGILHTWGQNLSYHIHVHFIVTGGGLTSTGEWKMLPYREKFLFPVKAVSKVVCGKFLDLLDEAYQAGQLRFPDELSSLSHPVAFEHYKSEVSAQEWYCYSKKPFSGAREVVEYIGRYTHRVAISNHRLLTIEGGQIVFSYKDYQDGGKIKEMSLSSDQFIQRFLWHIVPRRFRKIRHSGFLHNPQRQQKLSQARSQLEAMGRRLSEAVSSQREWDQTIAGESGRKCPQCQIGTLVVREVEPWRRLRKRMDSS